VATENTRQIAVAKKATATTTNKALERWTDDKLPVVQAACESYLQRCQIDEKVPLWAEIGSQLKLTTKSLNSLSKNPVYQVLLEEVKSICESGAARALVDGDEKKGVGKIFLLKSTHGYRDQGDEDTMAAKSSNIHITINTGMRFGNSEDGSQPLEIEVPNSHCSGSMEEP